MDRERREASVRVLQRSAPRTDRLVTICSRRQAVQTAPGRWRDIEQAIAQLGRFAEP